MKLINANDSHIKEMMTWFRNEQSLSLWSGPNFSFPFTFDSFKRDLKIEDLSSFTLVDDKENFIAFGQYYLRLGKCHLGRLVVNPKARGQGIGRYLIDCLSQRGCEALNVSKISLFVLEHNKSALNLYLNYGFTENDYPEPLPLKNCLYLIKSLN